MSISAADFLARWRPESVQWARQVLDVPEESSAEQSRRFALAQLARDGFMPEADAQQAILLLAGEAATATAGREGMAACQEWLKRQRRSEVEAFAQQFFRLPPAQRRQQWVELSQRCAFSVPLSARLEALEPGLDFQPVDLGGERDAVRSLAQFLQESFLLPPHRRAASRAIFLCNVAASPRTWQRAAQRLADRLPAVARLDAPFVHFLTGLVRWQSRIKKQERAERKAVARAAVRRTAKTSSGFKPWYVVPFIILLAQGLTLLNGPSDPSPGQPPPMPQTKPVGMEFDPNHFENWDGPGDPAKRGGDSVRGLFHVPADRDVFLEDYQWGVRKKSGPTEVSSEVPARPIPKSEQDLPAANPVGPDAEIPAPPEIPAHRDRYELRP